MKLLFTLFLFTTVTGFPQSERLTRGLENGFAWVRMEDPIQPYNTSKETYLSSILERFRLTGEKYPEISSFSCQEEIEKLYEEGNSAKISMSDIVREIDEFYSDEMNNIIPIIFAYCFTIKKLSGVSEADLAEYEKQVMKFCKE